MCDYITWFYDEKSGYVTECTGCERIQLCFGNLLLSFEQEGFENFRFDVQMNIDKLSPDDCSQVKSIILKTNSIDTNIILSAAELQGLHNILESADNERKAAEMISLFNPAEK